MFMGQHSSKKICEGCFVLAKIYNKHAHPKCAVLVKRDDLEQKIIFEQCRFTRPSLKASQCTLYEFNNFTQVNGVDVFLLLITMN